MNAGATAKPSTVYWIVGALSLLWNGFGGYDYWMTQTGNVEYLSQMGDPQEIIAWVDRFPLWAEIGYGLGVWGSVAGSILLLMRSRHAVTAFAASLLGAAISFASQMMNPPPPSLDTTVGKVMPFVILGLIALQWWWARRQAAAGNLG